VRSIMLGWKAALLHCDAPALKDEITSVAMLDSIDRESGIRRTTFSV
jgi:hypothetical protein